MHSNSTSEGKAKNRRVEFHVLGRESERGLRSMLQSEADRRRIANDPQVVEGLLGLASGATGASCLNVRHAAADILVACGVRWDIERLLWLAVTKNSDR
mmetsp:Transcript_47903/g.74807  ORF Transcript_47903/g.74807 Transcript_47903/m.74807 type:complete len:99 (-) Transcript_47903:1212-1508(-)